MAPFNKIRYRESQFYSQNILNLNNPFLMTIEQAGLALNFEPCKNKTDILFIFCR